MRGDLAQCLGGHFRGSRIRGSNDFCSGNWPPLRLRDDLKSKSEVDEKRGMKYGGAHELIRIARSTVHRNAIGGALHQPLLRSQLAADALKVRANIQLVIECDDRHERQITQVTLHRSVKPHKSEAGFLRTRSLAVTATRYQHAIIPAIRLANPHFRGRRDSIAEPKTRYSQH